MLHPLVVFFEAVDTFFWGYIGFSLITILGVYLTVKTRFFQIRAIPTLIRTLWHSLFYKGEQPIGISPIKALFASVGSMVGIGNLVVIITAIQIGGPGSLFWIWFAALCGSLIKYSEVYLGLKYRVRNEIGSYDGGPMYFLRNAYSSTWIPYLVALLLCIYGIEILQFGIVADSLSSNWSLDRNMIVFLLLGLVLYAGVGGVRRVANIATFFLPTFILFYIFMALWVVGLHIAELPQLLYKVVTSAFTGHAALGGFAGSTILLTIKNGIARAAYSADIGIGNDSVIQSESRVVNPAFQARLAVCGVFIDNFICTLSVLIVLLTGVWKADEIIPASHMVQKALSYYFPYMEYFVPLFLLILGYTTIIAYLSVGVKSAKFIFPSKGKTLYLCYAAIILPLFSFLNQSQALLIMSLAGSLLLIFNLIGIFLLRKHIIFSLD